jgi:hypothetical protein
MHDMKWKAVKLSLDIGGDLDANNRAQAPARDFAQIWARISRHGL